MDSEDDMDLDSEEFTTDSESNDSNEFPYWRQRRSSYRNNTSQGGEITRGVRRSPRLAARATSQTSRRTSQRQTNRRPN